MSDSADRESAFEAVELTGEAKENALRRIEEQVTEWGLSLPDSEPLLLHFGLGDYYTHGEAEFWIVNETDAGYCAKLMFVFEGQECPYHRHRTKHETFYVLRGRARMRVGSETRVAEQGEVLPLEPGTAHSFAGEGGAALLLEISMPSVPGDSFFDDRRIGDNGVI